MRRFLLLLLAAALAPAARAAEWIVGPGGFADLPSAYAAAAPGDVIRIRARSIPSFALAGKGVVIRGDGIVPTVQPRDSRISGIPSGQVLVLEDVHIDGGLELQDCIGSVVLHRVICWSPTAYTTRAVIGLNVERCSLVQAYDSTFIACSELAWSNAQSWAVGAGVRVRFSRAAFRDCRIEGCDGYTFLWSIWPYISMELGAGPAWPLECRASAVSLNACTTRERIVGGVGRNRLYPGQLLVLPTRGEPATEVVIADGTGWEITAHWNYNGGTAPTPRVRSFGSPPAILDYGISHRNETRPLPSVRSSWIESGQTLALQATQLPPGEPTFLGVSLAPRYWFLAALQYHGALLIDLDRNRSALLDVIPASAGTWTGTYRLSQAWLDALRDQPTYFQAFSLDAAGKLRCSMPDFAMR